MSNDNLFVALRAGFPEDLDRAAIETIESGGVYTWRDLERATAMFANLLDSLDLPAASRIAVQVEKSVESLLFYLAVLRAGHVYLPLNTAYKSDEIDYFIGDAEPAVFVCAPKDFVWASKLAFAAGTSFVFTLGDDRSGSLLERATHFADSHTPALRASDDLAADPLHQRHHRAQQGSDADARQPALERRHAEAYWGWRGASSAATCCCTRCRSSTCTASSSRSHGALLAGATMLWLGRFDARRVVELLPRATVFMGVPTLYVRLLGRRDAVARAPAANMRLFICGSAPLLLDTFEAFRERTGHTILERYGMSETVMLTSNPYDADGERRGGTVGFPLPGVEVRVVDDDGAALPPGDGRRDRGARPERLRRLLAHAREDARRVHRRRLLPHRRRRRASTTHGYLSHRRPQQGPHHQRRLQRLPGRDRRRLDELPGVAESAVVGVPHPDFGEAVVAVVVRARRARPSTADALIDRAEGEARRLQGAQARSSSSPSCRATRWARCRRTCCASSTRRSSPERRRGRCNAPRGHEKGPALARPALRSKRRDRQRSCA